MTASEGAAWASFHAEPGVVRWRLHLASSPDRVFKALDTAEGREWFWAGSAAERDGVIRFKIGRYPPFDAPILLRDPPRKLILRYLGTTVTFELVPDGSGGTDLLLVASEVSDSEQTELIAGWVSVLLALKAAVDFGVDLRNHDPQRTWLEGYADN